MEHLQRPGEEMVRRGEPALVAGMIAFLLLHVVASLFLPEVIWGAHHLRFLSRLEQTVWALLTVAVLLPWSSALLWRVFSGLFRRLDAGRRWVVPSLYLLLFLFFLLARTRNYFMGDGFLVGAVAENEAASGMGSAGFLSLTIHRLLLRMGSGIWPEMVGRVPFVLTSSLAGVGVVALCWSVAGAIVKDLRRRALLFASLAGSGGILLFFGYVEYYPLMQAALLLYLFLAIRCLQGRGALWQPTAAFLLAVSLHASAAVLAPSWIYLLTKGKRLRGRRLLFLAPVALAGLAAGYALLSYSEKFYDGWNALVPFFRLGDHSYTFISWDHLAFVGNQILLLLGGALLLFLLPGWRHVPAEEEEKAVGGFLALSAGVSLLYLLFVDPRLGSRDWDLMALPLFPFLLFVGNLTLRGRVSIHRRAAVLLAGAVLLHTFPWVAVQTDRERAVSMVLTMIARDPHYDNPRARAPKALGVLLSRHGFREEAALLFERALGVKEDAQNLFNLGTNLARRGEYEEAIAYLRRAVELEPGYVQARTNLAVALRMTGQVEEATALIEQIVAAVPDYGKARLLRGHLLADRGDARAALEEYKRCVEIDSTDAPAWASLARAYRVLGENEAAEEAARRANRLSPDSDRPD